MSMKKSIETISNRTCDLPTCSAVPQPTAPLRFTLAWLWSSKYFNSCFRPKVSKYYRTVLALSLVIFTFLLFPVYNYKTGCSHNKHCNSFCFMCVWKGGNHLIFLALNPSKLYFLNWNYIKQCLLVCGIFKLAELQSVELHDDSKLWNGKDIRKRWWTVRSVVLKPAYREIFKELSLLSQLHRASWCSGVF